MIDHISIAVRDLKQSDVFYAALLAPLGMTKLREWPGAAIGYGKKYPDFWINLRANMALVAEDSGVHICLRAPDTAAVDAFHHGRGRRVSCRGAASRRHVGRCAGRAREISRQLLCGLCS
jgi:catechol 2,3-dioxygenase-like lactoylglutathione lyase family enzyme